MVGSGASSDLIARQFYKAQLSVSARHFKLIALKSRQSIPDLVELQKMPVIAVGIRYTAYCELKLLPLPSRKDATANTMLLKVKMRL